MISAKKAKEIASGALNWWEKRKKQRSKLNMFLHLYSFNKEMILKHIKSQARIGKYECTHIMYPEFFLIRGSSELGYFNQQEQLEIFQLAVSKIESDLRELGYKITLEGSKLEEKELRMLMDWGLLDIKYKFYISWK